MHETDHDAKTDTVSATVVNQRVIANDLISLRDDLKTEPTQRAENVSHIP